MDTIVGLISALLFSGVCLLFLFLLLKRKVTKSGLIIFCILGSLFATMRLLIYFTLEHRATTHTMTYWVGSSRLFLYPEAFLFEFLPDIELSTRWALSLVSLIAGGYLWVLPLMLVRSTKRK